MHLYSFYSILLHFVLFINHPNRDKIYFASRLDDYITICILNLIVNCVIHFYTYVFSIEMFLLIKFIKFK